jgi:hypothetical protein
MLLLSLTILNIVSHANVLPSHSSSSMSIRSNDRSVPPAPQAPIRQYDEETSRSATNDPLAGLTVNVEGADPPTYDGGIGSLSLGDDFDDEAGRSPPDLDSIPPGEAEADKVRLAIWTARILTLEASLPKPN